MSYRLFKKYNKFSVNKLNNLLSAMSLYVDYYNNEYYPEKRILTQNEIMYLLDLREYSLFPLTCPQYKCYHNIHNMNKIIKSYHNFRNCDVSIITDINYLIDFIETNCNCDKFYEFIECYRN